jgi:hypothetical protein
MKKLLLITTLSVGACGQDPPVPLYNAEGKAYPQHVVDVCRSAYHTDSAYVHRCVERSLEPKTAADPNAQCGRGCQEIQAQAAFDSAIRELEHSRRYSPSYTVTYPSYRYMDRPWIGNKPFGYRTTETITVR